MRLAFVLEKDFQSRLGARVQALARQSQRSVSPSRRRHRSGPKTLLSFGFYHMEHAYGSSADAWGQASTRHDRCTRYPSFCAFRLWQRKIGSGGLRLRLDEKKPGWSSTRQPRPLDMANGRFGSAANRGSTPHSSVATAGAGTGAPCCLRPTRCPLATRPSGFFCTVLALNRETLF